LRAELQIAIAVLDDSPGRQVGRRGFAEIAGAARIPHAEVTHDIGDHLLRICAGEESGEDILHVRREAVLVLQPSGERAGLLVADRLFVGLVYRFFRASVAGHGARVCRPR